MGDEGDRKGSSQRWAWIEVPLALWIYALDWEIKLFISMLHFFLYLHFKFVCLQFSIYIYVVHIQSKNPSSLALVPLGNGSIRSVVLF
jgi:hypothetical protein